MLDELGLIHMNGRIYDPYLGRFLSADPIIQEPSNFQNYNRYSYVINNPLSLTDPSGHIFGFIVAIFTAISSFVASVPILSTILSIVTSGWAALGAMLAAGSLQGF